MDSSSTFHCPPLLVRSTSVQASFVHSVCSHLAHVSHSETACRTERTGPRHASCLVGDLFPTERTFLCLPLLVRSTVLQPDRRCSCTVCCHLCQLNLWWNSRSEAFVYLLPQLLTVSATGKVQLKDGLFVCWLAGERPSNTLVYLRDGSAQTILRPATLK